MVSKIKLFVVSLTIFCSIRGFAQTETVSTVSATTSTGTSRPTTSTRAPNEVPSANRVTSDIARAEAANDANALVLAYGEATRDPQLARGALTQLLHDYFRLRALAVSAPQASQAVDEAALRFAIFQAAQNQVNVQQNQRLLEQNQRIIEQNQKLIEQNERMINLLDQIARKR